MFDILTVFVCIITICKCRNTNIINHFYFYIRESVQAIIVFVSIMIYEFVLLYMIFIVLLLSNVFVHIVTILLVYEF